MIVSVARWEFVIVDKLKKYLDENFNVLIFTFPFGRIIRRELRRMLSTLYEGVLKAFFSVLSLVWCRAQINFGVQSTRKVCVPWVKKPFDGREIWKEMYFKDGAFGNSTRWRADGVLRNWMAPKLKERLLLWHHINGAGACEFGVWDMHYKWRLVFMGRSISVHLWLSKWRCWFDFVILIDDRFNGMIRNGLLEVDKAWSCERPHALGGEVVFASNLWYPVGSFDIDNMCKTKMDW